MPSSKKLVEIARVLHEEGYIEATRFDGHHHVTAPRSRRSNGIRRISSPA